MKRHFPGLHLESETANGSLEGLFLARVDQASYRWHPQKPFFSLRLSILEPEAVVRSDHLGASIWHAESVMETELVPPRFWLRPGSLRSG